MEKLLKNDRVSVSLNPFGGELTGLSLDGFQFLWAPDARYYDRTSPCLFPITGRFMDGYHVHNGKQYPLPLNGFAKDKTFEVTSHSDTEITMELHEDEETLAVYPFEFDLKLNYRLEGQKVHITYTVKNKSSEKMPYSVGNHTAYRWPLVEGDNPNSYFFRFEKNETLESFSPFGWTAPYLTDENIRPLSHDLYVNGTRSFRDRKSEWMEYTGCNCDYVVRMYSKEFPFVANWALPEEEAHIVCMEPSLSIASNGPTIFDRVGIHVLEPGCSETVSYTLEIYRKSDKA